MKKEEQADLLNSKFDIRNSKFNRSTLAGPVAALAVLLLLSLVLAISAGSTSVPLRAALGGVESDSRSVGPSTGRMNLEFRMKNAE